ncbi:hypothetical protein Q7P37_005369 [Cladosporium fusiforme]
MEAAAAIAQVVTLAFQSFQSCVDGYKLFHAAQAIGRDGDFLRVKLQKERIRLEEWAIRVNLQGGGQHAANLRWDHIRDVLEQQHILLTSSDELRKRYKLKLHEEIHTVSVDEKNNKPVSGLERLLPTLRPELYTRNAMVIQAANNTVKRLRWAVVGREKVNRVIDDLASLNDELERMLDAADRTWLRSALAALLREMLSRTNCETEVLDLQNLLHQGSNIEEHAIHAAATLKRMRLVLDIDKRDGEVSPEQRTLGPENTLTIFKRKYLGDSPQHPTGVYCTRYKGQHALVEWRSSAPELFESQKPHVEKLAVLLTNEYASLANLRCAGLVCYERKARFAFVYNVPLAGDPEAEVAPHCYSLQSLVARQSKTSLRDRLTIACRVAEAVLQLHTAGWLHKGIRSDNVIFVDECEERQETTTNTTPYLVGYGFARPIAAPELTVKMDAPLSTELYLHPEKRSQWNATSRKAFDLYGLATVLIEIALWEPLAQIFSRQGGEDWVKRIADAEAEGKDLALPSLIVHMTSLLAVQEITHSVGPSYCEAIKLCLMTGNDTTEEAESSVKAQQEIVNKLRSCSV